MMPNRPSTYEIVHRTVRLYLGILLGIMLILGLLNGFHGNLKEGGVWWFNLDKERNIPTWFSGALFFLFGCAAMTAYYWEKKRNSDQKFCFRLPELWLGVALVGWLMSLDEITILHENLYWREIRIVSRTLSNPMKYITQWQILFAPAILLIICYFVIFFSNRLTLSPSARRRAFEGLGCWMVALLLEGVRQSFKQVGALWYSFGVLIEELMEMAGAVFLMAAIIFYILDITLDFTAERRVRLSLASRFLTKRTAVVLCVTVLMLAGIAGTIYVFSQKLSSLKAPLPRLYRKAVQSQYSNQKRSPIFSSSAVPKPLMPKIWFEDIKAADSITDSNGEDLVRYIGSFIFRQSIPDKTIPEALKTDDTSPQIVFLSVSDGESAARVIIGSGQGLNEAIKQVVSQVEKTHENRRKVKWMKLDMVQDVYPMNDADIESPLLLERGLHGIALDRQSKIAFLPEELVVYGLIDKERRFRQDKMIDLLRNRSVSKNRMPVFNAADNPQRYRFKTTSFFYDGENAIRLFRGHRTFKQISKDELLSAVRRGGQYLIHAVKPDGKFVYAYSPETDTERKKYNIIRHAGTIYAMLELYETTGEEKLLQAAERAIEYLLRFVNPCNIRGETLDCVVERGYVKLGGNALAAISLAKYVEVTQNRRFVPAMLRLAGWIQNTQAEDGRFFIQKQSYPEGIVSDFKSQYYPGEAVLAMTRTYSVVPQESWLDTAEKGADYLINIRDQKVPDSELIHDHWLLYALNDLYRHRPKPQYLKHAMRIARAIMNSQNRNPEYPDWLGSYYRPPRSTPTATRSEGLYAAYRLARDFGDPAEAEKILQAIRLGVAFQLQTQLRPESVLYLKNPQRSLGGFRRSLTNFEIRIDYVQHNISSLLGLCRIETEQREM